MDLKDPVAEFRDRAAIATGVDDRLAGTGTQDGRRSRISNARGLNKREVEENIAGRFALGVWKDALWEWSPSDAQAVYV